MKTHCAAVALWLAPVALAQTAGDQSRTLSLTHAETPQTMQEVATMIRVITGIRQLAMNTASNTVAVRGTADEIALAEWLVRELDEPGSASGSHKYRVAPNSDEVVQVFHLAQVRSPYIIQEIQTTLRTVGDIRMAFQCNAPRALAARGTAAQAALAEWLVDQLDRTGGRQSPATHEFRIPGSSDDIVRVFDLTPAQTPQSMQEIQTAIRTLADVRKLFQLSDQRAIALRGTAGQAALSEWLVQNLDQPAGIKRPTMREYPVADTGELVRVLYLAPTATPQAVQEIGTSIRTMTGIRRLFPVVTVRALALRGAADQIAQAEQLAKPQ